MEGGAASAGEQVAKEVRGLSCLMPGFVFTPPEPEHPDDVRLQHLEVGGAAVDAQGGGGGGGASADDDEAGGGDAWVLDVETLTLDDWQGSELSRQDTKGDASFTGLWNSSKSFAGWLERNAPGVGLAAGASVLELGAGTGWLGMTVARNTPRACRVCVSDRGDSGAHAWTEANLQHNVARGLPLGNAASAEFDWADEEQLQEMCRTPWDVVIGSDLVYVAAASVILAGVIDRLLRSGTKRVIYAHTRGRLPAADTFWLQQIEAHGLRMRTPQVEFPVQGLPGRATVLFDFHRSETADAL